MVDLAAVARQAHFEAFEPMTVPISERFTVMVCERCSYGVCLGQIEESQREQAGKDAPQSSNTPPVAVPVTEAADL